MSIVNIFDLDKMEIHSCKGCLNAGKNSKSPCNQKDDMEQIYAVFENADVVVFASPLYFWTITGTLKTAADRLYAELFPLQHTGIKSILISRK